MSASVLLLVAAVAEGEVFAVFAAAESGFSAFFDGEFHRFRVPWVHSRTRIVTLRGSE